jgi:mono/diheme cytochrome c family protein
MTPTTRRTERERTALVTALAVAVFAAPARAEEPSAAAKLFAKKCGSCHTLGEGDRQGPDLKGVTERRDRAWVSAFIKNPGGKIDAGDPVATELVRKFNNLRMPDPSLNDEEVAGIVDYLLDCTKKGGCKLAMGKVRHASDASPAEVDIGRRIFEGRQPLMNGGASCISCHNVRDIGILGGGTLAVDLTHAYARLGDAAIQSALESTPFPLMKDVYGKKPLTEAEAFGLKAFLAVSAKDGARPQPDYNFSYLGVLGLFLALGAIGLFWSGRTRGVRESSLKRGKP